MSRRVLVAFASGSVAVLLGMALWLTLSARRAADLARPAAPRTPLAEAAIDRDPAGDEPAARTPLAATERLQVQARGAAPSKEPAAPAVPLAARIEARVLDEEGWPLEGAALSAPALPSAPHAASGPDGRVQLAIEALPGELLPEGALLFHFTRADRATAIRRAGVLDGETTYLGDVRLVLGATIVGRIRDPSGRPFAGARVWNERPSRGSHVPQDGQSAADGGFVFEGLPLGEHSIRATDRAGAQSEPAVVVLEQAGEVREIEILLPRSTQATVSGVVFDPRGAPVRGAYVSAREPGASEVRNALRSMGTQGFRPSGRTDVQGRFEVLAESPMVEVQAEDGDQRWAAVRQTAAAGERQVELRFAESARIEVHVRDGAGRAIPWSWIEIAEAGRPWPALAAGESGIARVRRPAKRFRLRAFAAGYRTKEVDGIDPDASASPLVVALEPGQCVRGRVIAHGRPLAGARIELLRASPPGEPRRSENVTSGERAFAVVFGPDPTGEATTDRSGRYVVTLHAGGDWVVRARAEGYAPAWVGPFRWEQDDVVEGIDLELARAGSLRGRVLTRADSSPEGVVVGISSGDGWVRTRTVGADGAYAFEGLAPGPWQVRRCLEDVGAEQRLMSMRRSSAIEWDCAVQPGATTLFDLDLRDEGSCVLLGRFAYAEASRLPWHASLFDGGSSIEMMSAALQTSELDSGGRFRLSMSKPGSYLLVLLGPGKVAVSDRVELARGETRWEPAIPSGRLVLDRVPETQVCARSDQRFLLRWYGEGELAMAIPVDGDGAKPVVVSVPEGPSRLVSVPFFRSMGLGIFSPLEEKHLASVNVRAGSEERLDFTALR